MGGQPLGRLLCAVPSDPYVMTGFDRKSVALASDRAAKIDLEFDITGDGVWVPLRSVALAAGERRELDLGGIRAYWVRAVSDTDCTASVTFRYE